MKSNTQMIIAVILGVLFVGGIAYGSFRIYRYVNWKFGYEAMVVETIQAKVKQKCLK